MAPSCPDGHPSTSTDYCDVCGAPMGGSGAPAAAAPAEAAPAADHETADDGKPAGAPCPSCATVNPPDSLFCEACGYDYTTGTMPRGASVTASPAPTADEGRPLAPATPEQPAVAGLLDLDTPAPESPEAPAQQQDPPPPQQESLATQQESLATQQESPDPQQEPLAPSSSSVPEIAFEWIAEVWIDPEWYALQQAPDPLPSPGLPTMVPLRRRSVLIGRTSRSRNIHPDIDCEPDAGISRRQAQLTTDGQRWFVEDLDSANGTFVAGAAEPLPTTPIPRGRRELDADDRLYVGAWTRIVLRRATPEEKDLYA